MKNNELARIVTILNVSVVWLAVLAWLQLQTTRTSAIDIAGLLALCAFSLMWVHYLGDFMRDRWFPEQSVGIQYQITRWFVLAAIVLHPALINLYLVQNDYGFPPNSYVSYLGGGLAPYVFLGWVALAAFLLFELKKQLKQRNWWRYVLHFNILAMFLILIHGFQLGVVTNNGWYAAVWWLYAIGFTLLALNYYMRYYVSMPNRKIVAVIAVLVLSSIVAFAGISAFSSGTDSQASQTESTQSLSPDDAGSTESDQPAASDDTISAAQLAQNNGKDGAECWIAIDGTVYDATDNPEWVDGEHVPSRGQASCGRDLSDVIGQSPHGTSVLTELPIVGQLE